MCNDNKSAIDELPALEYSPLSRIGNLVQVPLKPFGRKEKKARDEWWREYLRCQAEAKERIAKVHLLVGTV